MQLYTFDIFNFKIMDQVIARLQRNVWGRAICFDYGAWKSAWIKGIYFESASAC